MMTISPPVAASQAADYYQSGSGKELLESFAADEIKQSNFQAAKSEWSGEIAEKLDLRGEVGQADFEKVLDGVNPLDEQQLVRHRRASRPKIIKKTGPETDGEIVGRSAAKIKIIKVEATGVEITKVENAQVETAQVETSRIKNTQPPASSTQSKKGKTSEHRACWDITFSAPKSVSLAAIVGGDLRLIEAHRQAVATALREVENFAEARLGGNQPPERTGRLLTASFEHYAARPDKKENFAAADLHTHNPVMNFTFAENGKSYALQPQKLFASQKLGTAVYRLELAKGMNEIGYEIRFDEQTKAPEIAAISREYIEAVSPRQSEIKAKAKELNISSTRQIVVRYRSTKTETSADNIEFHRQIEKSFDYQAGAAVEESFISAKISQPAIIERLQAEVTLQQTKIFEKAEKRRNYYAVKQLKNQNNEQTGTERKTRTIEKELADDIIKNRSGNENNRTADDAIAVVPLSRDISITNGQQFDSSKPELRSDTKHQSDIEFQSDTELRSGEKLRNETSNRNGSQQAFGGTKRELLAIAERPGTTTQESGKQDHGNELGSSESFKRDENSRSKNDFEPEISCGKTGESAKSNSSESTARSGADEVQTITQPIAGQAVASASQFIGAPKTVAQSTAVKQPDGANLDDLLRADKDEQQLAITGDKLLPGDTRAENPAGISRVESTGNFGRELSPIIADDEVNVESSRRSSDNLDHDTRSGDNLTADLSDSDVLAIDRRDAGGDSGNNRNPFDIHFSDIHPQSGTGISDVDSRIDHNLWSDLLPVESGLERPAVQSEEVELFDTGVAVNEFPWTYPVSQFTDPLSNESGYPSSFVEIEQIFETQNRQETLAAEIVSVANAQRLQNQQAEISQAVQEKMFAYLMQLSESPAQNTAWSDNVNPTALEAVHQNFLTDEKNLEQFTQSVEEHHFNEERVNRMSAENSAQNNNLSDRNISDEEPEQDEDHPDFEEERGFSLSM